MTSEKNLKIGKSRNGKGVFAGANFLANETIYKVKGKKYHYTVLLERGGDFQNNCYRLTENYFLSPHGTLGEFFNHSCEPNAKVGKLKSTLFLTAIKDIHKGEEICFDYSTLIAKDDIWTMKCNCGSRVCRGTIQKYTKLPKPVLKEYLRLQIIPKFIQKFG